MSFINGMIFQNPPPRVRKSYIPEPDHSLSFIMPTPQERTREQAVELYFALQEVDFQVVKEEPAENFSLQEVVKEEPDEKKNVKAHE